MVLNANRIVFRHNANDDPDYVTTAKLLEYDLPRRLVTKYYEYYAKTGSLPFTLGDNAGAVFSITSSGEGSILNVEQTGLPVDPVADNFYKSCEIGWRNTFAGIRRYLTQIS